MGSPDTTVAQTGGELIRQKRRALRMTQSELGRLIGTTKATVGRREKAQSRPQTRFRASLSQVLGIDPSIFRGQEGGGVRVMSNVRSLPSLPSADSAGRNAYTHLHEKFLLSVISGLEAGHATSLAWIAAAEATARAVGIMWNVDQRKVT